ncbi:NAD(P)-dependent alcohol dehydrogenase [Xenorhabdus bovienii]|uniref:NAD(P)-dependent alcohol dehydrogenase n=1 Tax=Xenorhabdus bovienii TaxID=40576 RepID=UPI0023B304D7|nr:NAD(P)-dependent alcohol dehydrogenase [Xenorhabdus bovienii]MDE9535022.1 NAD(P)-dependent alcohol dehydrogenase [Xenorhabdus bovienii]MDE9587708.1 NAD(P)-dependent alcohol dehydrogenase [Xenorhabdus bovienii]
MTVQAYGAYASDKPLEPMEITRRAVGPHDVQIDIVYCGICHSDLHEVRDEWGCTHFPCIPGHEIVGRVSAVGTHVSGFKSNDLVGIGCIINSCKHCEECESGFENYCDGMIGTHNSPTPDEPSWTLGGYSQRIIVHERYVLRIRHPEEQLAAVAPLLCAGITTYSPLRHWEVGPGKKVGIVGIGGLGHLGIKLAHVMGAHVVAFTTSESKRKAARMLGADEVVLSSSPKEMSAHSKSFDLIIDTVAAPHDLNTFLVLLKRNGILTLLGVPPSPHLSLEVSNLLSKHRAITGSMVGGIPETQEMLDFCAKYGIVADIELIRADEINGAYERMLKGDVKYRFVIDNATLAV